MYTKETQLTEHFLLGEFLVNEFMVPKDEIVANLKKVAEILEHFRKTRWNNAAVIITSGYRNPMHNAAVGGKRNSYHMKGMAADFVVKGWTPSMVQGSLSDWTGGLEYAPTWVHLDIGPRRRFYV